MSFLFMFVLCQVQPDYLSVQKLSYMDMVLNESMRLHPIAAM